MSEAHENTAGQVDPAVTVQDMIVHRSESPAKRHASEGGKNDATTTDFLAAFEASSPDFGQYHSTWLGQIYGLGFLDS